MRSQIKIIAFILTVISSVCVVPPVVAQPKPQAVAQGKQHPASQASAGASNPAVQPKKDALVPAPAFVITQKHYFLGRWQVFVNGDKVKVINLTEGYGIVTMAPTWKVVFFRDNGAKMCETTMKSFLLTGVPISNGYVIEGKIQEARQHEAKFKGLKTLQYDFERFEHVGSRPAWTMADMPKEAGVSVSHYWVSRTFSRDDRVCNFLQKLFMVPATVGYPVAFIDTRTDHTNNAVLDILSCKARPPAEVEITYPSPAKYKMCQGLRDVTLSPAKRDSFNEWAQAIGKD